MKPTLSLLLILIVASVHAQDNAVTAIQVPEQFARRVDHTISSLDDRLTKQSEKYLRSLSRQEEKIRRKLAKLDSSRASEIFKDAQKNYEQRLQKLAAANGKMDKAFSGQYLPGLDSLQGALGFLKEAKQVVSKSKDIQQKLSSSLEQAKQLQNKLQQADEIKQYVQERQYQLKELLSNYTHLPKDITRHMGKYRQDAYYYGRQVQEYKEALNDPDKLMKKVLATLQAVPAFKKFMQQHSMLAQLFPTPDNYGTPQALAGLQTRAGVQQMIQQRIGMPATNGANASPVQYLQQQMQQAQGELGRLKDRLNQLGNGGSGSSDMVIPDFKPNGQKTRSFLQRIELGTDFQTRRSNHYFPTTTDIALTAGYKMNDKSIIGVGLSGKVGWGKDWKHIRLTGEGAELTTVIPPSPTSREFDKYIHYDVSLYNGIPEISIPLYTIQVGNTSIPITLSYHASGIKFGQGNGEVGVGWVLNPGYRISRTINGRPDEVYEKPVIPDPLPYGSHTRDTYLSKFIRFGEQDIPVSSDYFDGEFDLFTYSAPSESGEFVIEDRQQNKIRQISHSNLSTTFNRLTDNSIDYFDLKDGNGMNLLIPVINLRSWSIVFTFNHEP